MGNGVEQLLPVYPYMYPHLQPQCLYLLQFLYITLMEA